MAIRLRDLPTSMLLTTLFITLLYAFATGMAGGASPGNDFKTYMADSANPFNTFGRDNQINGTSTGVNMPDSVYNMTSTVGTMNQSLTAEDSFDQGLSEFDFISAGFKTAIGAIAFPVTLGNWGISGLTALDESLGGAVGGLVFILGSVFIAGLLIWITFEFLKIVTGKDV